MAAWIAHKAPPTFVQKERGYNFDYDLKRRPVDVHDDEHGRIKFATMPWQTVDEYLTYPDSYQDYRRGERTKETNTKGSPWRICGLLDLQHFHMLRSRKPTTTKGNQLS